MRRPTQLFLSWAMLITGLALALLAFITYELERVYPSPTRHFWNFTLPLCLIVLVFMALGVLMRMRATRRPPGHCRRCGYDLTGNDSGVCPECGKKVPQRSGGGVGRA